MTEPKSSLLFQLEQLSACIAHELNDPLEAALAALPDTPETAAARGHIEQVIRRNLLLRDFTYLMLNSEREGEVALEAVLETVLEALQPVIEEKQAVIERTELPRIRGRARQWRLCLQHLLHNALHYHGETPPVIHIGCDQVADGLHITLRDHGTGIRRELSPLAFGLFWRLEPDGSVAGEGCGLCFSRLIVENHGGELHLDSVPGEYSCFTIALPAARLPETR